MRRHYFIMVTIIAYAAVLCTNNVLLAGEDAQPNPPESAAQKSPSSDEQEAIKGYPARKRKVGKPMDVEWDLDNSFPKSGSALELILQCGSCFHITLPVGSRPRR